MMPNLETVAGEAVLKCVFSIIILALRCSGILSFDARQRTLLSSRREFKSSTHIGSISV